VEQPWLRTSLDFLAANWTAINFNWKFNLEELRGCGYTRRFSESSQCGAGEAALAANWTAINFNWKFRRIKRLPNQQPQEPN
jgi:hypothetical protein